MTTWKTSTIFSVSALSSRFHRPQKIPERVDPSLRRWRTHIKKAAGHQILSLYVADLFRISFTFLSIISNYWTAAGLREAALLAVDENRHPLGFAADAAALYFLCHIYEFLRFLWQTCALPLQELEMFHLPTIFSLLTELFSLSKHIKPNLQVKLMHRIGKYEKVAVIKSSSDVTLTCRTSMVRVMKTGVISVLETSTSKSPNVSFSFLQYRGSPSCQQEQTRENKIIYSKHSLNVCKDAW